MIRYNVNFQCQGSRTIRQYNSNSFDIATLNLLIEFRASLLHLFCIKYKKHYFCIHVFSPARLRVLKLIISSTSISSSIVSVISLSSPSFSIAFTIPYLAVINSVRLVWYLITLPLLRSNTTF